MARQTLYRSPHSQVDEWPPRWPEEPLSDEKARDVFLSACAAIAENLADSGFRYTRSSQKCRRMSGAFAHSISFQSSGRNFSGHHVQLWMHAIVSSPNLKTWRAIALPEKAGIDYVAGGMVHLITDECALVQWELANPLDRAETIEDATAFIRERVLPFFANFDEPGRLVQTLSGRDIPGLDIVRAIEVALCFEGVSAAQRVLDRCLSASPSLLKAVQALEPTDNPESLQHGSYAQQVLYLCQRFALVLPGNGMPNRPLHPTAFGVG
jgi:hypothetical protein